MNFTDNLKFGTHIMNITKKASSTLGFIKINLKHCPLTCGKTSYTSLVRSTLEYSSIVWDPYLQKDIDRLESVQRKAVRFITCDYRSRKQGCITRMLKQLELPPLQDRRKMARLAFFFKVTEGFVLAMSSEIYLIYSW